MRVCIRACKHGCDVKMFCFSRANHASTNLIWVENSTRSYFIYPFPRQLCKPETKSRVCIWREFSQPFSCLYRFISGYATTGNVITWLESKINTSSRPLRTCFFSTHFIYFNVIVQEPEWSVSQSVSASPPRPEKKPLVSFGSLPFRDNQVVAIKNYHCKIQHKKELRMVFQKR